MSSPGPSSPILSSPLSAPPSLPDIDEDLDLGDSVGVNVRTEGYSVMDIDEDADASDSGSSMRGRPSSPSSLPYKHSPTRRSIGKLSNEDLNQSSRSKPSIKAQIFRNFTPKRRKAALQAASVHSTDASDLGSEPEGSQSARVTATEARSTKSSKSRPVLSSCVAVSKPKGESDVTAKRRERTQNTGPSKKRPRVVLSEPDSEMEVVAPTEVEDSSDVENIPVLPKAKTEHGKLSKKGPVYKSRGKDTSVRDSSPGEEAQVKTGNKSGSERKRASSSTSKARSLSPSRKRSRTPKAPESEPASCCPLPHDEMQGMLIEALATSRASSLAASTLYTSLMSSRPALKDALNAHGAVMSKKEWVRVVEDALEDGYRSSGVFGKVDSGAVVSSFPFSHLLILPNLTATLIGCGFPCVRKPRIIHSKHNGSTSPILTLIKIARC